VRRKYGCEGRVDATSKCAERVRQVRLVEGLDLVVMGICVEDAQMRIVISDAASVCEDQDVVGDVIVDGCEV